MKHAIPAYARYIVHYPYCWLETFLFARGSGARLGTLNHEWTVLNDKFLYQLLWNYKAQCPVPAIITRDVYHDLIKCDFL
jgi:hypothetical protein